MRSETVLAFPDPFCHNKYSQNFTGLKKKKEVFYLFTLYASCVSAEALFHMYSFWNPNGISNHYQSCHSHCTEKGNNGKKKKKKIAWFLTSLLGNDIHHFSFHAIGHSQEYGQPWCHLKQEMVFSYLDVHWKSYENEKLKRKSKASWWKWKWRVKKLA